jgi:hypothetical protein
MNSETQFRLLYTSSKITTMRLVQVMFLSLVCTAAVPSTAFAQDHVGNALGGEAKVEVLQRYDGPGSLPKPARVVIRDFANAVPIAAEDATSHHHHHHDSDADPLPDEVIQQLRDSFAKTATGQFKKMNLETDRVSDAGVIVGPTLLVEGEFISVVQGSSRKRIIVGFGRGASDLRTHVVISELIDGQKTVLLDCNVDSKSGKKPGAVLSTSGTGFVIGAATGHFGDKMSATVQADASRTAKLIGKETKAIMVAQQWVTKPSQN